jgi:hypothetical protein
MKPKACLSCVTCDPLSAITDKKGVALPELREIRQPNFSLCGLQFKRLAIFMRRGLWLFLVLVVKLCGNPSAAAEFVVADGPYRDKDASPSSGSPSQGEPMESAGEARSSWRLVRSAGANNEPGSVAILHTVDFERSNPRLAGLMLRCDRQGIETVIVVVEPYPPHARPQITLRTLGQEFRFIGTILPTGAGIRLPSDAMGLLTGTWHKASELEIKVTEGDAAAIDGVVALSGLSEALESLNVECVQK